MIIMLPIVELSVVSEHWGETDILNCAFRRINGINYLTMYIHVLCLLEENIPYEARSLW
jgi:hypothetical protein